MFSFTFAELLTPKYILYFALAGASLGLLASYPLGELLQRRIAVRLMPPLGAALGLAVHAVWVAGKKPDWPMSFFVYWQPQYKLWWLYPVFVAGVVALIFMTYFPLRNAVRVDSSWKATNAQEMGVFFPLSSDYAVWGKAVWRLVFVGLILLIPCCVAYLKLEYEVFIQGAAGILPNKAYFLATGMPAFFVVFMVLTFVMDLFAE